jgi:hypothetical protein
VPIAHAPASTARRASFRLVMPQNLMRERDTRP